MQSYSKNGIFAYNESIICYHYNIAVVNGMPHPQNKAATPYTLHNRRDVENYSG
ncbi:hypothetical protein HMPREF9151_01839 [Hoylesella saccharolytica F0055]|uniref:Uncharacterized protein n=1 Tax=Hoylesella saccharolytica F0055 TaxID=1127699 RepID=L1N6P1_9BACT|nr:hypothetical protein HMPREF9151_01839 [Hoylesella saccharolytica F0055]